MYSLTVVTCSRRINPAEYKKYMSLRKLLKEYSKHKISDIDMKNLAYAEHEMKTWVRVYREGLKASNVAYTYSFTPKNKMKLMGMKEIPFTFEVSEFNDKSISNNLRHEMIHKNIFLQVSKTKMEWLKELRHNINMKYKEYRKKSRSLRIHTKTFVHPKSGEAFSYRTCGSTIYTNSKMLNDNTGFIMKLMKSRDKEIIFQNKSPKTKNNYIGVEIEFFCDLDKNDLSYQLLYEGLGEYVSLHQDGSIQQEPGTFGHEVCIMAKEKEIYDVVKRVSKLLQAANARVNKSCGLHVHLDMRNRDHNIAFNNLVRSQNVLFAMNPFARQAGTFCKRIDTTDFKKAASQDRYFGINAQAYEKHNTIEIRIHAGTILDEKINNWIKLLLTIACKKEAVKNSSASLKGFINEFNIDSALAKYVYSRVSKFAGEDKKNVEEKGVA